MAKLPNSLCDWQTDRFSQTLKTELEGFKQDVLPLKEVIDEGNYVDDSDIGATIIEVSDDEQNIHGKVGIYFAQIVSCCSCGESPPIDEAYCEMMVSIDKSTAEAEFKLIPG